MLSLLVASLAVAGVSAQLSINTPVPGAAQCEPQLISFSGGTGPYFVSIQTNPVGTTPFLDFGQQPGPSVTWTVNDTIGASLLFQVKDSTGASQTSAPFSVIAGNGDSCLTSSGGGSAPAGNSGTSAPAGSTPAGSTPAGASTPAASGTSAKTSGTTSAPASKSSGSASTSPTSAANAVQPAVAGVAAFAAVILALIA
uniref:Uncharacterized protein n=1 Tax=Mycena chlorophos TaxID=658473 RepID=A0ABQ0MBP8_MYCCL|nr:predicted protein [Mycena chlorophos]